jgi:hypothetical protein
MSGECRSVARYLRNRAATARHADGGLRPGVLRVRHTVITSLAVRAKPGHAGVDA